MTRDRIYSADRLASGFLTGAVEPAPGAPLLVCIHGGGSNSGYFEIKGHSTVARAERLGFPILLVDRPGHGGNPSLSSSAPIEDSVSVIERFIAKVHGSSPSLATRDLALIGHSIGGAVVLTLAAQARLPLRSIAVSGIGDEPAPAIADWWRAPNPDLFPPDTQPTSLFLGPEGTYGWQAPIALRKSSEPWQPVEVAEIVREWPLRWPQIAPAIAVPVHLRLAEHERIWRTGAEIVARMKGRLSRSPAVDAALLPEGGHLYEIHKRGPELIQSQLEFLQLSSA